MFRSTDSRWQPEAPIAGWTFHRRVLRWGSDDLRRFQHQLRRTLRAAHGLGTSVSLLWETGPTGRLILSAGSSLERKWWATALAETYERGQWTPVQAASPPASKPRVLFGLTRADGGPPIAGDTETLLGADAIALALPAAPPFVRVMWNARPLPSRRPTSLVTQLSVIEPWRVPQGFRLAPITTPERRRRDRLEARRSSLLWGVSLTLVPLRDCVSRDALNAVAQLVAVALRSEDGHSLHFGPSRRWFRNLAPVLPLTEDELMGLFPTPTTPATDPVPLELSSTHSVVLGTSSQGRSIRLSFDADQGRHMAVVGETGMGKSSLLIRIARDLARNSSVVLLDPIGDTGRRLIAQLPLDLAERTTWISPSEAPVGLNALEGLRPESESDQVRSERVLGDLVNALRRVRAARYSESPFWGPRIEETVARALEAAATYPEGTLVEAHQLLNSVGQLRHAVPESSRSAIDELRRRVRERPDEVEGARRLLREIAGNRILRELLCATDSTWSVREMVKPQAISVICGDAPKVGESAARYLLAVYLALLWSELLSRPVASKIFVLLDEAHWYVHESLNEMLRMGRRFNIHVCVATQALNALSESVRTAVLTNSSDFVVFRGSPDDARDFVRWVRGISVEELLALPSGHAAVLLGKGSSVDWLVSGSAQEKSTSEPHLAVFRSKALRWARRPLTPPAETPESVQPFDVSPADPKTPAAFLPALKILVASCAIEPTSPTVRIYLERLRGVLGSDASTVRDVGAFLSRFALLTTTGRDEIGSFWEVSPNSFLERFESLVPPAERDHVIELWRRVNTPELVDSARQGF